MGNRQTNLNIEPFFVEWLSKNNADTIIHLNLDPPAICKNGKEINKVAITLPSLQIHQGQIDHERFAENRYVWEPKSHMRDFEVMDPYSDKEIKIARGQGIGVIISDQTGEYIKLYYDKTSDNGLGVIYTIWDHSREAKYLMSSDLSLGYDMLFITKDRSYNLCEEKDQRDDVETLILFKDLKKYSKYEH